MELKKTPPSPTKAPRSEKKISYSLTETLPSLLIAYFAATIITSLSLCWSVALVMHQALEKAGCMLTLYLLVCVQRAGYIIYKWAKLIFFFTGGLSVPSTGLSSRFSSKCPLMSKNRLSVNADHFFQSQTEVDLE